MNYKIILNTLGKILVLIACLMILPMIVAIIYNEKIMPFLIPIIGLIVVGTPLAVMRIKDKSLYAKEGFVIVVLVWIIMSLVGCTPFLISKTIPNFIDAFFETVSGFTTTGGSVLTLSTTEISIPKGIMFWRTFTHWIGGMGVLVLMLALMPSNGNSMHLFRVEAPGPSVSKFVSKIRRTATILYLIYMALSLLMVVFLLFGNINLYESLCIMFSTAGTGGFSVYGDSIAHYNSVYVDMVISVFMFLFGLNFNVYYFILIGKFAKAFNSEEVITYLLMILIATLSIAINIVGIVGNFWESLRYAFFQTGAFMTTTGFVAVDFIKWPAFSQAILLFLSIVGACGGSTGGGMKISRMIILSKSSAKDIKQNLRSRSVNCLMYEHEPLDKSVERNVRTFLILWIAIVIISTLLLSLDGFAKGDLYTNFASSITCIGNVGPVISKQVGSFGGFAGYNGFSKIVLCFDMLAGRLEIFPIIILLTPRTWKRGK